MCFFNGDDMLAGIEDFVGGSAPRGPISRKLVTVLYTDIVESTLHAVEMGDGHWATLLAAHHASVRDQVERHDGRLIKTMGDGVLATFDRPTLAVRCALAISRHAGDEGVQVRGVPGRWSVHAVVADRREDQRPASQATPEQAALTPAPIATMTATDRALVGVANRAPRLSRFTLRMLSGRPRSKPA